MSDIDSFGQRTLDAIVRLRASRRPDKRAFTFLADGEKQGKTLTYGELDLRARNIAACLQELGAAGDRVLLLYPPGLEFIAAFLGCLYAGFVAVPSYPPRLNRPSLRLQAIVGDAQAGIALTTEDIHSNSQRYFVHTPELAGLRWFTTDAPDRDRSAQWREPRTKRSDTAFLQYTSGSTAEPKGAMVSHENLLANLETIHACFETNEESRGVFWLPVYHDMGLVGGILETLYCGAENTLLSPLDFAQRPLRWLEAVSRTGAEISGGPNFAYDWCVQKIEPEQRKNLDLSNWKLAFNGAEPVRAETMERFAQAFASCGFRREAFYPCYGLAEATLIVSGGKKADPPVVRAFQRTALAINHVIPVPAEDTEKQVLVGCGRPAKGQYIVVVDPEASVPCPAGQIGEIWVSGNSVVRGYWNRPEENRHTFEARLAGSGEKTFLRTGDMGFIHEGELHVTGRLKDMIVIRGLNHYPQDIERTVERCHIALEPGRGAAFSVDMDGEERLVIAHELKRTERNTGADEVVQAVRKAVAEEHALQVHAVALLRPLTIPLTSSGKIQRSLCRKQFLEKSLTLLGMWINDAESDGGADVPRPDLKTAYVAPRSETERQLADIWSEVMKLEQVGVEDDFFELGGDSLMAARIFSRVRETFGMNVQMEQLLEQTTVAAMAGYLETVRLLTQDNEVFTPESGRENIRI
jgi:acyl-CoA synthetase (AMP-forming)/AMP-acid ligase II/acyl carrier protein